MKKVCFPVRMAGMLLAACVLGLASGCASLPAPEMMQKEVDGYQLPKLPEKGKALVYVVRPGGWGAAVRFNVFVDDKEKTSEMGYNFSSQYIYFNLMPGRHKILSNAENWAEIEVEARAGDIIFIQQEVRFGVVISRNNLIKIEEQSQGKYRVKTLELGTIIRQDRGGAVMR
jgi:hypothetical protein